MEKSRFQEWWDEKDDVDRVGIIFTGACLFAGGVGFALGYTKARRKAIKKYEPQIDALSEKLLEEMCKPKFIPVPQQPTFTGTSRMDFKLDPNTVDELSMVFTDIIADLKTNHV